ncbi:MAG: hypothetical protein KKC68_00820 [Candidatus Thermoplasmatota archaeon]|nr:hypothetical protein [Candidatus Thermoplasmatota archaeon]MBU1940294.1 hypothetical protein [Candidatus Thermoplasmatota archaeon]
MIKKKHCRIGQDTNAVVGVVVAILLVGLFLAIMLVVQTVYVPNLMEQREAEHMEEVAYQFSLLKYAIDIQSISGKNTPIATSVTLGSKELPFLTSDRSFGYLDVSSETCNITMANATYSDYILCGSIKYSSLNSYFLDQQYIYETGAVISNQTQGNAMAIRPPLSATLLANLNISWDLFNIIGVGGKTSVSGYGTYPVQTQFYRLNETTVNNIQTITITTKYRTAWDNFLRSTFTQAGLTINTDYTLSNAGGKITLTFLPVINADLHLKVIEIRSQIAPGWIE